jgi:hypothetical protein
MLKGALIQKIRHAMGRRRPRLDGLHDLSDHGGRIGDLYQRELAVAWRERTSLRLVTQLRVGCACRFARQGRIPRLLEMWFKIASVTSNLTPSRAAIRAATYAETEILAISPALGRLSMLQQAPMTRRIVVGGRMPSARSANLASN